MWGNELLEKNENIIWKELLALMDWFKYGSKHQTNDHISINNQIGYT